MHDGGMHYDLYHSPLHFFRGHPLFELFHYFYVSYPRYCDQPTICSLWNT